MESPEAALRRLFVWDDPAYDGLTFKDMAAFHEWCVELAVSKFKGKRNQEAPPVCCYVLMRPGGVSVLNTPWQSEDDKRRVQYAVRRMMSHPMMAALTPWIATINEVWIASQEIAPGKDIDELRKEYGEVRNIPGREDGLMVMTQGRDGKGKATRWVVKPKPDPSKSIMLARDDLEMGDGMEWRGHHVNYFEPEVRQ